ncbi:MAG TPA: hypothetical protein VIT23_13275, partial [Terrimicrobiaceae bacterium]
KGAGSLSAMELLVLSQIAKLPVKRLELEFVNVACLFKNTRFHSTPNVQGKSLSLIEAGVVRENNGYKGLLAVNLSTMHGQVVFLVYKRNVVRSLHKFSFYLSGDGNVSSF